MPQFRYCTGTPAGQIVTRELDEPSRDEALRGIDDLEQEIDAEIATERFCMVIGSLANCRDLEEFRLRRKDKFLRMTSLLCLCGRGSPQRIGTASARSPPASQHWQRQVLFCAYQRSRGTASNGTLTFSGPP